MTLTPAQVAKKLHMSRDWVYEECKAGRMPHIKLGRSIAILPDSLMAWLKAKEESG